MCESASFARTFAKRRRDIRLRQGHTGENFIAHFGGRSAAIRLMLLCCSPQPHRPSTRRHGNATRNAGVGQPAIGHRLASSPSIRSATPSSGRRPYKSRFPVRSTSLLSRPDLATPKPRSTTEEMGGAEPPAATRSAPHCASMARMASTAPSPQ